MLIETHCLIRACWLRLSSENRKYIACITICGICSVATVALTRASSRPMSSNERFRIPTDQKKPPLIFVGLETGKKKETSIHPLLVSWDIYNSWSIWRPQKGGHTVNSAEHQAPALPRRSGLPSLWRPTTAFLASSLHPKPAPAVCTPQDASDRSHV